VSREPAAPPRVARLLPRRELGALLDAFVPLAAGSRWCVRDAAGAPLVERGGAPIGVVADDGAPPLATPLTLDGTAIGTLELASDAACGDASALLGAARSVIEQALAAASIRRELAAETLERYREVNLAYRLGEVLDGGVDLEALPARVLDEAVRAVQAPHALLVLDDDEGGRVAAALGSDAGGVGAREALAAVRAGGHADRAGIDVDERPEASAHAVRLWAPLRSGERSVGGLLLTRPAGERTFSAGDAKLLTALAGHAATSLEKARLQAAELEQARLARELQLAHDVQARLMPTVLPSSPTWRLAAWWSAAREVSGDFYDATRQGDATVVTIGDVADKGMAAALFMALTRSVLRASAVDGRDPGDVVTRANALLCADASDGMFVTLAHAHLGPDGTVRYANGGHNPPLLARADGGLERLERTGILVGWDETARYGVETVRLAPGDALVMYTDGVTEARDESGAEYGEARLVALVREHVVAGRCADAIVAALRSDLARFVGRAEAFDDATVLVAVRGTAPDALPGQESRR
jgi:serine phosphatase RsbU (regulator of sigma subunit)